MGYEVTPDSERVPNPAATWWEFETVLSSNRLWSIGSKGWKVASPPDELIRYIGSTESPANMSGLFDVWGQVYLPTTTMRRRLWAQLRERT